MPVAIQNAHECDLIVAGADSVMMTVSDHQRSGWRTSGLRKRVLEQIGFVAAGAVEFRTKNVSEKVRELKVIEYPFDENVRFA
jgi:hypothetical protein